MRYLLLLILVLLASPALAQNTVTTGTPISEPSNMALFGLGLVGLIIGRYVSNHRNADDSETGDE